MWKVIQTAVVFAVLASNVHFKWTPNPYAAAVVAVFAAMVATVGLSALGGLIVRLRGLRFAGRPARLAQGLDYRDISAPGRTSARAPQALVPRPRR